MTHFAQTHRLILQGETPDFKWIVRLEPDRDFPRPLASRDSTSDSRYLRWVGRDTQVRLW
jgi:hypothetical protein